MLGAADHAEERRSDADIGAHIDDDVTSSNLHAVAEVRLLACDLDDLEQQLPPGPGARGGQRVSASELGCLIESRAASAQWVRILCASAPQPAISGS